MSTVEPLRTTSVGMLVADFLAGPCPIPARYMETIIGKELRTHRLLWIIHPCWWLGMDQYTLREVGISSNGCVDRASPRFGTRL